MQIQLSREGGAVTALLPLDDGTTELISLSPIEILGDDLDRFLTPLLSAYSLMRFTSVRLRLRHLAQLAEALQAMSCHALPKTRADWQTLVLGVHNFIHTREDRKQSLATRHQGIWKSARGTFRLLAEEGLLPVSVQIPPVLAKLVTDEQQEQLIGDSDPEELDQLVDKSKLLMPISLSRTDAQYMDEIRDELLKRRQALFESLVDYWQKLKLNLEFGRNLRTSISEERYEELTSTAAKKRSLRLDPSQSLEQLAVYLMQIERDFNGHANRHRGNKHTSQYRRYLYTFPNLDSWPIFGSLPKAVGSITNCTAHRRVWTWLGRLSPRDVSVVVALLIMLNPQWTPSSLCWASVVNRDGKLYLDMNEVGLCFEVEKQRAKAMKQSTLCALTEDILATVLSESAGLRERLALEKHPLADRLFLPFGHGDLVIGAALKTTWFLSGGGRGDSKWIGDFYPALPAVGLTEGTINYRKIRATEGVLEWFRTKSVRAASKKIGNTTRVVLEHYIPKAIIQAWHTRCVRRFQNLWITVAAAGEPFLLDVTDFSSLGDLNIFVADLLEIHGPTSSPLAAELHLRLGSGSSPGASSRRGELHVALSSTSLTALYRYSAAATRSGVRSSDLRSSADSAPSPAALIQLADLLQLQLPLDRNPAYRRMHEQAMAMAADGTRIEPWLRLFWGTDNGSSGSTQQC